jgi:hypothetical protein
VIWLSWRQHWRSWLVVTVCLMACAAFVVYEGWTLNAAFYAVTTDGHSVAGCLAGDFNLPVPGAAIPSLTTAPDDLCQQLTTAFYRTYEDPPFPPLPVLLVPALVGVFLGAPLVAGELEGGTFRFVWTQSVTRTRWLLSQGGAQVAVAALAMAILVPATLYAQWPVDGGVGNINLASFDVEGVVPLAYTGFAFALAVAAGAVLRNTVGAMFAGFIGYAIVRSGVAFLLRPHFIPPLVSITTGNTTFPRGSWILANGLADSTGPHWLQQAEPGFWMPGTVQAPQGPCELANGGSCGGIDAIGQFAVWQPADRFWQFQAIESALFIVLAICLFAFAAWWIRRRVA